MTPEEKANMEKLINDKISESIIGLGDHLAQTVQGVVKITVNGKIDRLSEKLDTYIKADTEWKVRAEPMLQSYEVTTRSWALTTNFAGNITKLLVAGAAIWAFVKYVILSAIK